MMPLMILKFIRPYALHIVLVLAVLAAGVGVYVAIRHQGVVAAERVALQQQVKQLQAQIAAERDAAKKAAELKEKQQKEVTNARKEVDDAYRRGTVPDRVRKFYID